MSALNTTETADTLTEMSEASAADSSPARSWRTRLLVEGALVIALVVGGVAYQRQHAELRRLSATLNDFCGTTESEVASVIRDLENENPRIRAYGIKVFYNSGEMHTNKASFAMCLDEVPPLPADCVAKDDVQCLIKVARDIERNLHVRNSD
ncbi:MAG: hypothetical protein HOV81_29315 [Kofleriaceae bacterium]|nr:hypothetical protein [Kofleriaceae bacterium]